MQALVETRDPTYADRITERPTASNIGYAIRYEAYWAMKEAQKGRWGDHVLTKELLYAILKLTEQLQTPKDS